MTAAKGLIAVFLTVLLLPGCALTEKRMGQVDARVAEYRKAGVDCPPPAVDRCADSSPVLDFAKRAQARGRHYLTLIEYGEVRDLTAGGSVGMDQTKGNDKTRQPKP